MGHGKVSGGWILYEQRKNHLAASTYPMEPPSSPSSTITAPPDYGETPRRLAKLIVEAMTCTFALLHYDSTTKSMIEWYW